MIKNNSSHLTNRDTFFDTKPVRYTFASVLLRYGFRFTYKPREVMFKRYLDRLGINKTSKVLDVGCGDGILLERICTHYGSLGVGIDVSRESIARAKVLSARKGRTSYMYSRAEKLPFKDKTFDIVVSFDTLEHVGHPNSPAATRRLQDTALGEMVRVLKPKGRLLIYTINSNQKGTFNQLLARIGIDIYSEFDHYHALFLDPEVVKKSLIRKRVLVDDLTLYNAFFTLMLDESIVLATSVFKGIQNSFFQTILIRICHWVSIVLLPILTIMDRPWIRRGVSNSFFITGTKQ